MIGWVRYHPDPRRSLCVRSWPAESQEVRPLGLAPIRRLRAILHGIQHPQWGHSGSDRWSVFPSGLCGVSRFLYGHSQRLNRAVKRTGSLVPAYSVTGYPPLERIGGSCSVVCRPGCKKRSRGAQPTRTAIQPSVALYLSHLQRRLEFLRGFGRPAWSDLPPPGYPVNDRIR